jgi:hypothetical protein
MSSGNFGFRIDAAKSLTSAAIDELVGRILLFSRCYAPKPKGQEDSAQGFNPGAGIWTFFAAELANIKPGVEAWIAAQRLNRLAQVL